MTQQHGMSHTRWQHSTAMQQTASISV